MVVVVGSLRTACSIKDYCSPVVCFGVKQRTPSPSSVSLYDMPGTRPGQWTYGCGSLYIHEIVCLIVMSLPRARIDQFQYCQFFKMPVHILFRRYDG